MKMYRTMVFGPIVDKFVAYVELIWGMFFRFVSPSCSYEVFSHWVKNAVILEVWSRTDRSWAGFGAITISNPRSRSKSDISFTPCKRDSHVRTFSWILVEADSSTPPSTVSLIRNHNHICRCDTTVCFHRFFRKCLSFPLHSIQKNNSQTLYTVTHFWNSLTLGLRV